MQPFAHGPDSIKLGDLTVRRLGYGAMRLPGPGVWGEPADPDEARRVLRRAIELGVNLIDTAWYYGPHVSNRLIAEALHPYPSDLVIATKLGGRRPPDRSWVAAHRPEELREGVEEDLRSLRRDRLDVVHLRWIEHTSVPFTEALDALIAMQREGKIHHLALSNVTLAQLETATARTPIVSVQNMFSAGPPPPPSPLGVTEGVDAMIAICERQGIAFLPFFPLAMGQHAGNAKLAAVAKRHDCSPAQIAIAWLLARSPAMLPIPGTSSVEQNCAAAAIRLDAAELAELAS